MWTLANEPLITSWWDGIVDTATRHIGIEDFCSLVVAVSMGEGDVVRFERRFVDWLYSLVRNLSREDRFHPLVLNSLRRGEICNIFIISPFTSRDLLDSHLDQIVAFIVAQPTFYLRLSWQAAIPSLV